MITPQLAQRPNLATLPNELLANIFDHTDIPTLLAIARTSRQFLFISIDHILSTFHGGPYDAALFLRTLASLPPQERTRRAELVREIVWETQKNPQVWGVPHKSRTRYVSIENQLTAEQWVGITETFHGLDIEAGRLRESECAHELGPHAFFEFFLLFVPKLERVEIYDAWLWDDNVYWFTNLAANKDYFERLHSITIHGPLRLENVIPLLKLPSLRTLDLTQVVSMRRASDVAYIFEDPNQSMWKLLRDISSNIEHLSLRDSYVESQKLCAVLGSIRALKSLIYEHASNDLAESDVPTEELWGRPFAHCFAAALDQHSATLAYLRLATQDVMFTDPLSSLEYSLPSIQTLDVGPFRLRYDVPNGPRMYCERFQRILSDDGLRTFRISFCMNKDEGFESFAEVFEAGEDGRDVVGVSVMREETPGIEDFDVGWGEKSEIGLVRDIRDRLEAKFQELGSKVMS